MNILQIILSHASREPKATPIISAPRSAQLGTPPRCLSQISLPMETKVDTIAPTHQGKRRDTITTINAAVSACRILSRFTVIGHIVFLPIPEVVGELPEDIGEHLKDAHYEGSADDPLGKLGEHGFLDDVAADYDEDKGVKDGDRHSDDPDPLEAALHEFFLG